MTNELHSLVLPVRKEINMLEKIKDERQHNIVRRDDRQDIITVDLGIVNKKLDALLDFLQKQNTYFKQIEVFITIY